ncbi:MAG: DUF11 domain-containing protein, partial [Anaerolineales bacterium]|nr:DUF11 domain-containing protein [Anaerolineales bacterium]
MGHKISLQKTLGFIWSMSIGLILLAGLLWFLPWASAEAGNTPGPGMSQNTPSQRGPQSADELSRAFERLTQFRNPLPSEPHVRLEKNTDYYDAASVAITQVTSLFIDEHDAWERYQMGELDAIPLDTETMEEVIAGSTYSPQMSIYPNGCIYYYGFSNDVPPFDDELVRAAFATSIDREKIINENVGGFGIPALTLTPPGQFGHVDGYAVQVGHEYSPTLAAAYLAASGYSGGLPDITLLVNDYPGHIAIAQSIQGMWFDTLGVSVTIEALPYSEMNDLLRNGDASERPGIYRQGWCADYPDAHNWHQDAFLNTNMARYESSTYQTIVDNAAGEQDPITRAELYEQAERYLVMTDTAIVPIYYNAQADLTRPDIDRSYRPFGAQHLDEWSVTVRGPERPLELASATPSGIDPAGIDWQGANQQIVEQLFLGLTDITEDGDVIGELATAWTVSEDGLVYTFTLRSDAEWTDGSPVTAGDIEYGILRSLDPDTNSGYAYILYIINHAFNYNQGNITDPDLVGVEALSDTLIRFELERPAAYFPAIAGLPPARPQPEWAITAHGDGWTEPENIVTNGTYKLVSLLLPPYLRIEKEADGTVGEGSNLTFRIHYYNDGGGSAENVVITDTLVSGMVYLNDTSGIEPSIDGNKVIWELGTVDSKTDVEFQVFVQVTAVESEIITNTAQIATSTPNDQGDSGEKLAEWSTHVGSNNTHLNIDK